jgi:hypothetical protein
MLLRYHAMVHSSDMDDTNAEKIKVRTAIHGALDKFQPVDISFHRAVAPGLL